VRSSPTVELRTQSGFATQVRPHWPAMQLLARRLVGAGRAEDVVQDALTLAWRKRADYCPERGTPRAWLLALTADQARKALVRHRSVRELPEQLAAPGPQPADLDLQLAVSRLSGRQRLAVELHYFIGLPVAETAAAMGCAPGTVKSTLFEARAKLRTLLGEDPT